MCVINVHFRRGYINEKFDLFDADLDGKGKFYNNIRKFLLV
jgi:hypothetical protein